MADVETARCRLDLEDERLWRDGHPIHVTNKAFQLLRYFVQNPSRLITKDELLANLWPGLHVSEGLVKEYVHDLRIALGDDPNQSAFIETVRGRGYRYLGGIDVLLPRAVGRRGNGPGKGVAVAVLPFRVANYDPEEVYLAGVIFEDIRVSLSRLSQLLVISRPSDRILQDESAGLEGIAADLGVDYVIEGVIGKRELGVQISLRLTDCHTGRRIWVKRFDRSLKDISAVRDEVTGEAVSATAVKLCSSDQGRPRSVGIDNMRAYDYFLRGRELFWTQTKDGNSQAKAIFKQAMDVAPRAALPRAFLSAAHLMDYINGWSATPEDSLEESYELARKTVELGDIHPWSRVTLGNAYLWSRQHEKALVEYERAIAQEPNLPVGYVGLGWAMHYVGKSEQTVQLMLHGIHLDPHYFDVRLHWLAQAYFQIGQYDKAIETLKRRIIRKPDTDVSRILLAASYGQTGRLDKARAEWEAAHRINPDFCLARRRRIAPYKDPHDLDALSRALSKVGRVD